MGASCSTSLTFFILPFNCIIFDELDEWIFLLFRFGETVEVFKFSLRLSVCPSVQPSVSQSASLLFPHSNQGRNTSLCSFSKSRVNALYIKLIIYSTFIKLLEKLETDYFRHGWSRKVITLCIKIIFGTFWLCLETLIKNLLFSSHRL